MSFLDDIRALLGQAQAHLRSGAEAVVQNVVQPAFNTVGDVLGTPASLARGSGVTLGRLIQGDKAGAQQAAERTMRGVFDPSQRIGGQEAVGGNSIVSDIVTDPLAMGGLAKLGEGVSGALLRRLGSSGIENVAPAARPPVLRGNGLSTYTQDASGNINVTAPGGLPSRWSPTNMSSSAMAEAPEWTGRPLGQLQNRNSLAEALQRPLETGGGQAGSVENLMPLRRQFTVARDLQGQGAQPIASRLVGGTNYLEPGQTMETRAAQIAQGLRDMSEVQAGESFGSYNSPGRVVGLPPGAPAGTARHEIFHGMMDTAGATNNAANLPLIPRLSLAGQYSNSPLLQGLGVMGEEAAAQGVGQSRNALGQARGMVDFLRRPYTGYVDELSRISPLAADIYGTAAIPRTAMAGYGAGAGGAAALLQALGGQ